MTRGPALRTLPSESDCGSQRLAGAAAAIADSREPKLIITPDLQMAPKAARCAGPVTSSVVMGATGRTWAPTHDTADCRSWPSFLGHRAGAPSLCLLRRLTLPLWLKKRLSAPRRSCISRRFSGASEPSSARQCKVFWLYLCTADSLIDLTSTIRYYKLYKVSHGGR
jgi:hypothetical protein